MIPPSVQAALGRGTGNIAENVSGPLNAAVGGRTDHLPISVPTDAYVIPADIVSGLGQGNTANGVKVLQRALAALAGPALQAGGTPAAGKVDIMAAGGEFVVPPQVVAAIGHGDLRAGHKVLDRFVTRARAETIRTLRAMPGPKR